MNKISHTIFFDILAEKLKRDSSVKYNEFVQYVNDLAKDCKSVKELEIKAQPLYQFLPHLDIMLSTTNDYDDIMNMKATLLDLFVNDLNYQSINLLVVALTSNKQLSHLQSFIEPIEHWVSVIKSKEHLLAV